MKLLTLAVLVLAVAAVAGVMYLKYRLANTPDKKNLEANLDSEVNKFTRGDPSYALVIGIYKDGKTIINGYGTVKRSGGTAPNGSTIFQLGSITKLFTAATFQILSDEKVLDMDSTLNDLIGKTVELSPQASTTTLRQLVTHTSGFPSIPKPLLRKIIGLVGKENLLQNPYSNIERKDVFDYLKTTGSKRNPGRFKYSNFGMGLLGHVMEIVTKMDLESLVAEKILAPSGMRNTAVTLTPDLEDHLAQGNTKKGKPSPVWTFSALGGAGAFNSNVEDMLRFVQENISGDSEISHSLKKMHAPQFGGNTGIGWIQPTFMDRFVGNQSIVWHNGMVGGYSSYISVDTKNKTGVIALSNKSVDITTLGRMLTRQVRTQSSSALHQRKV